MKMSMLCLALFASLFASALPVEDTLSAEAIQKLLDRGKYAQAAEALDRVVEEGHPDGLTWVQLALARHLNGEYEDAIVAGQQAIGYPDFRATSLYNLACSYSLLGDLDGAEKSLLAAMDDGFVNTELIESDSDLAALRTAGRMPELPPKLTYEVLRARNRLEVPYKLLLPDNFDQEREYPFVLAFAPGQHGRRDADWMISELLGGGMGEVDLVTVVVVVPDKKKGWMTHPSHHALEDLLKKLRKEYSIRGNRFTFFGFLSGNRPAVTYSQMSKKYAAGLIVAASSPCQGWKDSDVRDLADIPFTLIAGSEDVVNRPAFDRLSAILARESGFDLKRIEGADHRLKNVRGAELVALLAKTVDAQAN